MDQGLVRNFAIIAHVDHGKSTLADRLMEATGTITKRDSREQLLDTHPISRERGITIRLAPVTMNYTLNALSFKLNLIDTPGHVDFSYEVERSLAACEGAILLVDATQGVQAQTLSHFRKAEKLELTVIVAINKIDSPNARIEETMAELDQLAKPALPAGGFDKYYLVSAKTGEGVEELLKAVVEKIPPPNGIPTDALRALVFSSEFDPARGVTAYIRIVDGRIQAKEKIKFLATNIQGAAFEIGHFAPNMTPADILEAGEVGYITTNLKDPSLVRVGDTITTTDYRLLPTALPGYRQPQPMVFVSLFPVDQDDFKLLEDGLSKLKLNDAAITFSLTFSKALGRGFRCGFLGHLHAEVSQERLERDFGLSILATQPTVEYKMSNGQYTNEQSINNLVMKQLGNETVLEPWVKAIIITPADYVGAVMGLCEDRRGKISDMTYHGKNATLVYELPLVEIITDFFDKLKSASSGYASMDYELVDYRRFEAVRLDILINHEAIDAFSQIMEKSRAGKYGRFLVERLKEVIPRQQIPIPIQAAIDNTIIARADIPAFRKDVTAKLYGGDATRRMKLLEKQKKGKEKMLALSRAEGKLINRVQIPGDTFLKIFRTD